MASKNNLSLKVLLQLQTEQFKKGAASINKTLNGLWSSFKKFGAGLGATLGLTAAISDVKNLTKQLSVAKATLRNVSKMDLGKISSGSGDTFTANYDYVKKLASDYKQDILALTESFAQFHAAADGTNLSLEQQKDIFEALTRASAYYNMSASRTQDMMNAIVQMMSKGKVAAEELRRQLGNSMPGAFQLMARAMGVSTAELEKLMKAGKVSSEEVLPKFAAMLNSVTKNLNTDNLQAATNELKNAWTGLIEGLNFENPLKNLYNTLSSVIKKLSDDTNATKAGFSGLLSAIGAFGAINWAKNLGTAELDKQSKSIEAKQKVIAELRKQNDALAKSNEKLAETFSDVNLRGYIKGGGDKPYEVSKTQEFGLGWEAELAEEDWNKASKAANNYNANLKEVAKNTKKIDKLEIEVADDIAKLEKKSTSYFSKVGSGIKGLITSIAATIKSIGIAAIASAIIGALVSIVDYLVKTNKELKKAKEIINDFNKEKDLDSLKVDNEIAEIEQFRRIATDITKTENERAKAIEKLNKLMGNTMVSNMLTIKSTQEDINKATAKWVEGLKDASMYQFYTQKWVEAKNEEASLIAEREELMRKQKEIEEKKKEALKLGSKVPERGIEYIRNKKRLDIIDARLSQLQGFENTLVEDEEGNLLIRDEIGLIKRIEDEMDALGIKIAEELKPETIRDDEKLDKKSLAGVLTEYAEKKNKLENQKSHGIFKDDEEYNEALNKLQESVWEDVTEFDDLDNALKKINPKLQALIPELAEGWKLSKNRDSLKEQEKADKEYGKAYEKINDIFNSRPNPNDKKYGRDQFFDYKKTPSEIYGEDAESIENLKDDLEDYLDKLREFQNEHEEIFKDEIAKEIEDIDGLLKGLGNSLNDLQTKAKVSEWVADVQRLKKDLRSETFNGIRGFISDINSLYDSIKGIKELFEDDDATFLEKTLGILQEISNVAGSIYSIYEGIQTIKTIQQALDKATGKEEEKRLAEQIVGNKALAEIKGEGAIAASVNAGAEKVAAEAMKEQAVAKAVTNAMQMPYPYNLAALSQNMEAIAAAFAASKALQAFAHGGIVGGSNSEHPILAHNGEAVLNEHQQGTLFNMLKNGGTGGQVEFKLRGTELIGLISNTNRVHQRR